MGDSSSPLLCAAPRALFISDGEQKAAKADPSPGSYPQGVVSLTPSWVQVEDILCVSRAEGLPLSLYDTTSGESARERIGMQDRFSLLIKAGIIILSFFVCLFDCYTYPEKISNNYWVESDLD